MPTATMNIPRPPRLGRQRRSAKPAAKTRRGLTWGEAFGHLRGVVKGAPKDLSAREGFG